MSLENTHHGAEYIKNIMENGIGGSVFFSGVGGVMMSSLASLTKRHGYNTYGSDRAVGKVIEKLENDGITVYKQHNASNIPNDCIAFIYTVAISSDNPEYIEAKRRNIPCISRADYLGYIMTGYKNRIGVAGMHGKSSVTSMITQIFFDNEKMHSAPAPTVISGAEYKNMGGAYILGDREDFIFEACEYMDSFLDFNPTVAVLLNAEMEHVDYFKSMEQIRNSFYKYASLTGKDGICIANRDDENIMLAIEKYEGKVYTFGLNENAYMYAKNIESSTEYQSFDLYIENKFITRIKMKAHGIHNVYNALAAALASYSVGVPADAIEIGLYNFCGASRRMEYKGEIGGACIYDDYGHHPTEVKATLSGANDMACGRLICVFQPHTYSRTYALKESFKNAFSTCDKVIFADIYAAREENVYGISSKDLSDMIGERAIYGGSIDECAKLLLSEIKKGDTVVVMGAGDIFKIYGKIF